mmetsp:Transcript_42795/g.50077  ORF Transcript_42795/g.50077 Transcript_42795/m.50077 type:complete len:86 (+) Transcript_42795:644-901(+)
MIQDSTKNITEPNILILILCVFEIISDNAVHPKLRSNSGLIQEPYFSKDHSSSIIVNNIGRTDMDKLGTIKKKQVDEKKIKENRQ